MKSKTKSCLECATMGMCVEIRGEVCGTCRTVSPLAIEPRGWGETQGDFRARAFEVVESYNAALLELAPVENVVEAPAKARCPHYAVIREFFAIAREMGYDTSKESRDRWRGAMGVYLGIRIQSRADLSAAQWRNATTGLRAGVLFV
jgi:hypothetical protein